MSERTGNVPIIYTVSCKFADPAVGDEWVTWLRHEHLRAVLEAGALRATVMRVDRQHYEVHYRFESREAYDRYISEQAPRLREEGLRAFPLERGLTYSRHVAEVVEVMER